MPTFNIGQLSSGVYYDGTPVRPNQSVVPVLLVVDSNGKTASLKGDPITIVDVVPPLVTGTLSQTQGATDYKITPSGLTISDDANGVLKVYHILATSLLTDATLTSIIGNVSFVALVDYGFNQNLSYVAGTSPSIVTSDITGLRVSKVYTGSSFREITHGDSIVSHVLAVDPNGLKTLKTTAARRVTDYTAPTLSGFTLGTVAGGSVSVSWNAVLDAGDDAITPATATNVYVGVYTANNNTLFTATPSKIVEGGSATGITGFVRLISISNEATTTLNIGNGGDGGAALVNGTNYFIYAVARDAASNYSTVSSVTSTTLDTTDPLITSFAVSQNSTTYEFSATAGTVSDNVSGNLRMYLIMSSTTLATDAEFLAAINSTTNGGLETTAKNETITYASGNSVNVITAASGSTTFKTTKFWNKSTSTYAAITETAPGTPYKLRGYLVVRDAANNIGFGETVETDVVDKNAPNLSSFTAGTPLVDKVPLSWTVTEGRSYKMYIVAFETPQTMSATEVYTGTKAGQLSRATITTSSPYSFGTGTNGELALSGSKTYYFYAVARDGTGNMSSVVSVGPVNTVDVTAPVIGATAFGVTQGTSDYMFTASGSYKDNRTGTLTAHLVLSPSTHTTEQLKTILAASTATPRLASATKTSAGIAANTDVSLSGNDLKTNQYWNGTNNWVTITEIAPVSYTLNAYLVVYDGATTPNVSSFNVSVSVVDKNAPTFSGSLTLALEGTTGIKVTWSTGFADGRGIADAKVYYGTTAPTSTSVADITTWKSATTTYYQTVTTAAIAAAGNSPVTGLTAGTTYYVYVCVKDAANNELNVATTPASVAIPAAANTIYGQVPVSSLSALQGSGWISTNVSSVFDNTFKPSGFNNGDLAIGSIRISNVKSPFTLTFDMNMSSTVGGPRNFFEILSPTGTVLVRVGRANAPFGTTGAVFIDDASGTFNTSYTTPATLTLGTTKQIKVEYIAPLLIIYVAGVLCNPSVNLSISPYSISGPLNIGIGSDTIGMTASYSNIVIETDIIVPVYSPSDSAIFDGLTSTSKSGSAVSNVLTSLTVNKPIVKIVVKLGHSLFASTSGVKSFAVGSVATRFSVTQNAVRLDNGTATCNRLIASSTYKTPTVIAEVVYAPATPLNVTGSFDLNYDWAHNGTFYIYEIILYSS